MLSYATPRFSHLFLLYVILQQQEPRLHFCVIVYHLQLIRNAAAAMLTGFRKPDHIKPPLHLHSDYPFTPLPSTYSSVLNILPVFLGTEVYFSGSSAPSAQEWPAWCCWLYWKYKLNNSSILFFSSASWIDLFLHSFCFLFLWAGSCTNEGHEPQGHATSQLLLEVDLKVFNMIDSIIHSWILIAGSFYLKFHPDSRF